MSKVLYRSVDTSWLSYNGITLYSFRIPFTAKYEWTKEKKPKDRVSFIVSCIRFDINKFKYSKYYSWWLKLKKS